MKKWLLALSLSVFLGSLIAAPADFKHDLTGEKKPWSNENFPSNDDFHFIIIPDRAGGERKGIFEQGLLKAARLRPDFIMSVGDLIDGMWRRDIDLFRAQWTELKSMVNKVEMPFFYVVGNHDINRYAEGARRRFRITEKEWKKNLGENTYYAFTYKNVLFICLNSMSGSGRIPYKAITPEQMQWAKNVLEKNPDVRWTFIFMHHPGAVESAEFKELEKTLVKRQYTVFTGDWHRYVKYQRHGRDYYVLATCGGTSKMRGPEYGEFDHITFVSVSGKKPVVTNILLDGFLPDDVVTQKNSKHPLRKLDLP